MKKYTLILIFLLGNTMITNAQIPNSGFETWENYTDGSNVYQKPDFWNGSLPYSPLTHSFSLERNPESYPAGTGLYSMKIQPDLAAGVRGVAISNDNSDAMAGWIPKPSFAVSHRPASMFFYYKCFPFGGDTIIGKVYFYKNGVVIGNPVFGTTQTVSNWTPMEMPMTYTTSDIPDSATIFFVTGAYIQHSESTFYVDNLSFDGFVTSVPRQTSVNLLFRIYPNPASDIIRLNIDTESNADITINIYTVIGKLVKSEILMQNNRQIHTGDLSNGIYMVEIKSNGIDGKQKLFIQRQ